MQRQGLADELGRSKEAVKGKIEGNPGERDDKKHKPVRERGEIEEKDKAEESEAQGQKENQRRDVTSYPSRTLKMTRFLKIEHNLAGVWALEGTRGEKVERNEVFPTRTGFYLQIFNVFSGGETA